MLPNFKANKVTKKDLFFKKVTEKIKSTQKVTKKGLFFKKVTKKV